MKRDEVVDLILRRISRKPGNEDLTPDIIRELNLAQTITFELGHPKPWFLLNVVEVLVDATGYKAPLPADFLELFEESPAILAVGETGGLIPLEHTGRAEMEWSLTSPNSLTAFELDEYYVLFASKLTAGTRIRMLYYQREPVSIAEYNAPVQPSPNRWYKYAPDLLIGKVGTLIAGLYTKDKDALAVLAGERDAAMVRLIADNTGKKEASRERFMNGALYPVPDSGRLFVTTGNISDPADLGPRNYDSIVNQGADWIRTLTYSINGTVVDLTNYSAMMQVKTSYGAASILTLQSTPGAGITLGGAAGTIGLHITADQATSLAPGLYAFDLEITDPLGKKARVLQGTLTVTAEVTT